MSRGTARALLIVAGAVMLCILLFVGRWLTFWLDEWLFIFDRGEPTAMTILTPFLDTFVGLPVLVYDALLATFGLRTYLPYLLVAWTAHFVVVGLLYRIVGRRSGPVLGLMAGLSMLFLGSGFEVLLHPFQIQYLFAIVGGLLAIDQLDRPPSSGGPRRCRIAIAAGALVAAIASSGLGVIFTGLILVWGLLLRNRTVLVAVTPALVIYAAWYFTWGRQSGSLPGAGLGLPASVYSVVYGMGAAVTGLIGLPPARFALLGVGLIAVVAITLTVAVRRGFRPDPLAVGAVAALLAMHVLQTVLRGTFGVEHGSRSGYVYAGAIFLWVAICGLAGDRLLAMRWRLRPAIILGLLLVPMILGNMRQFAGVANLYRTMRATEFAELRLIEELRGKPGLALDVQADGDLLTYVTAARYFEAIDRYGHPVLDGDWERYVDRATVEATRRRLLPR